MGCCGPRPPAPAGCPRRSPVAQRRDERHGHRHGDAGGDQAGRHTTPSLPGRRQTLRDDGPGELLQESGHAHASRRPGRGMWCAALRPGRLFRPPPRRRKHLRSVCRGHAVTEFGGPEALHVLDVPDEPLGPGQVRLRVAAAAVAPTDHLVAGAYADRDPVKPPWVPGMDAAGVVAEVGAASSTSASGTGRPSSSRPGRTAAPRGPRPRGLGRPRTGGLGRRGGLHPADERTDRRMALDRMALSPGQVLAVTGAAGAFGGYVVQLGKADGLTVVADASEADEQLVRDLGADVVVRRGRRRRAHPSTSPKGVRAGRRLGAGRGAAAGRARRGAMATVRGYRGDGSATCRCCPPGELRGRGSRRAGPPPAAGRGRSAHPAGGADVSGGAGRRGASGARAGRDPRPPCHHLLKSRRPPRSWLGAGVVTGSRARRIWR